MEKEICSSKAEMHQIVKLEMETIPKDDCHTIDNKLWL